MKKTILVLTSAFLAAAFYGCNGNKKLQQENAAKAIQEFAKNMQPIKINNDQLSYGDSSLVNIDPLNQFSETEADAIAHLRYFAILGDQGNRHMYQEPKAIKFLFKKNVDGKWMLISLAEVSNESYTMLDVMNVIDKNKDLHIVAQ